MATDLVGLAILRKSLTQPSRLDAVAGLNPVRREELMSALVANEPLGHGFRFERHLALQRRQSRAGLMTVFRIEVGPSVQRSAALSQSVLHAGVLRRAELVEQNETILAGREEAGAAHKRGRDCFHVVAVRLFGAEEYDLYVLRRVAGSDERGEAPFELLAQLGEQPECSLNVGIRRVGDDAVRGNLGEMEIGELCGQ